MDDGRHSFDNRSSEGVYMKENLAYAIDFGTSNSLIAAAGNGRELPPLAVDPTSGDPTILRSLMYFPRTGPPRFGQQAVHGYTQDGGDGRFIRSIKKYLPAENFTGTQIGDKVYSLEDLIGCFLREMKNRADGHFQQDVRRLVLGRPARFSSDPHRDRLAQERLEAAARGAGFDHIEFFPEPLAAAYDYRKQIRSEKLVLVVDLGGGTSDFTVIRIHPARHGEDDVLSVGGVSVAGDALDGCLMGGKIAPHFGSEVKYRLPMSRNVLTMPLSLKFRLMSPADITLMSRSDIMHFLQEVRRCAVGSGDRRRLDQLFHLIAENLGFALFEEIESWKKRVCMEGDAAFEFFRDEIEIKETLSYREFTDYGRERIEEIFATLDEVMKSAQVERSRIDLICCTGGTSKIPAIRDGLAERFGEEKIQTFKNFHSVIGGLVARVLEVF